MNPYVQYMYSYPHKTAYGPLEGISLKEYARLLAGGGHGLYLHIPFCQGKCGYCNLFSVTGQGEADMDRYLDGVERQSCQYQEILKPYGTEFSELTIGGGTPLFLSERNLERMFALVFSHFTMEGEKEIVIETAPNQTEQGKLEILKKFGVTRVSMGIQSFRDQELRALGRGHQAQQARQALKRLMAMDFPCVNVDFIYGIPGQTVDSLKSSLREAVDFGVDEIFLYPLYVRCGVGLVREGIVPDPEAAYRQYQSLSVFLRSEGFRQDSMRRFVRKAGEGRKRFQAGQKQEPGRGFSECGFQTSLALGCGGRSYVGELHFSTPYDITHKGCLAQLQRFENTRDFSVINHGILLSEEEQKRRYVIRHLLIRPGIPMSRYEKLFGSSVTTDFSILEEWKEMGFVEENSGKADGNPQEKFLSLTDLGMGLSDYLGPMLISKQVDERMKRWKEVYGRVSGFVSGQPEEL